MEKKKMENNMSGDNQIKTRAEVFELLKEILSEVTDNKIEDIREDSLIFNELNLTDFDLQKIIKEIGNQIEIDVAKLSKNVVENDEIVTAGDVLDLIVDEKELG